MGRARRARGAEWTGGIPLWKPAGLTSRAALDEVQRRLGLRGLGHTGTLDPLASGILVLVGGQARKFQDLLMRHPKTYDCRIVLGVCSESDDGEGPLWCPVPKSSLPDRAAVERTLEEFVGSIEQIPPIRSAVHVDGERSHVRARRGECRAPRARTVEIHRIDLLDWQPPQLHIRVRCGAGTYVRSLARDLGEFLGVGAFLAGLRRVAASGFEEPEAVPLAAVSREHWLSLERVVGRLGRVEVDEFAAGRLAVGQPVKHGSAGFAGGGGVGDDLPSRDSVSVPVEGALEEGRDAVAWEGGTVLGIVRRRGPLIEPVRWLRRRD